jgi:predicted flap endonuclease-1-like 5' DNA nuclease
MMMERDHTTDHNRISTLVPLVLGFILGLVAGWLYWLQHLEEQDVVETAETTGLRVELSPRPREAEADDLTRIEGIGPKFASVLRSAGLSTYEELAASSVDELRSHLRERGLYFADPATWPEQAELAAVGAWGALSDLQEELTAGRRL